LFRRFLFAFGNKYITVGVKTTGDIFMYIGNNKVQYFVKEDLQFALTNGGYFYAEPVFIFGTFSFIV
jgi:hypothetical protein